MTPLACSSRTIGLLFLHQQTEWSDSDISFPLLMAARTHLRSAVQIRRFGPEFVPASEWDRMVHNAYRIELKGDSQRKKRPPGLPEPITT